MLKAIIRWSIHNRFIVIALTLFLIALGVYALFKTPVDAIPDLSDVQVIVKTPYPGQAPQVVEDQVTYPLSTAMLAVPGAVTVRGYSFFGDSYVYILFKDGTDPYWARSRVLEYLSQIGSQLPPNAKPELGPDATGVGWVYQYALVDKTGQRDLSQLTSLQNWLLKYDLQTVPDVSEVATVGGMVKQYQITLHPNQLRAYGLTLAQVKQAVQKANQEVGGSVAEMGEAEYMIRATGYIQKIKSIEDIPLGLSKEGTPILLSDVATVKLGPQMRRGVAELNGQGETVGGVIVMRQGENALDTIKLVKEKLAQLQSSLPQGVEIVPVYDRSGLITRAIHTLSWTLLIEFLVVAAVCLLFLLHFRSSLVVILSLPIGVLVAFIIMRWQGLNANIMSLGGIAIAIGVMVDAAIIMVENMHKQLEKAQASEQPIQRWKLVEASAIEVGPTLFFSLLITTLSFLPVFALQAQEGRLFAPLAFTKTYAMAAASGLAITLVPVLMGYFIRGRIVPEQRNPINRALLWCYKPVVTLILRFPKTLILLTVILFIVTFWPASQIGSEFMPDLNEGDLMYMPTMLPGVSIGKARQVLQQTDKLIKQIPEVKSVLGKVGRAETATDPAPMTMIESVIQLKPESQWRKGMTIAKLKQVLDRTVRLPGVTNAWVMPIRTRIDMLATGIKTPVGIKILGPHLKEIQTIGEELEKLLPQVKGTTSVYADRAVGGRYIQVDIKRQQAARYGLNIADVQTMVQSAIGGINVTETIEGRERYPVNLRYPQAERQDVDALKTLPIVTPTGAHIALSDVAHVYVTQGPPAIKSENAQLTGWVLVDIAGRDLGSYTQAAQQLVKEKLKLPPGYRLLWTGQYEYMQRAKNRLMLLVPLTLVLIFFLLYLNSRSLIEVLIIMGTLPLSFIGGIWLLYWLDYNLSVAVGVGFIALAGVAVETGMVLLNYLNNALKEKIHTAQAEKRALTPDDIIAVIKQGALYRVRPIMMAVAATFAGLLPVMLSRGTGSEVMRRIAAPMVGGLITATLLTLVIIPAIYYLWKRRLVGRELKK
ncbi:MAG: CusA/CzcA family heavy metal efflux RND transporter [Gammaproteobacteria bacterium CG11_big_fil_rev_8_21_14_0_20_46_22]|nr:MAG: CusA/CzcA family heavy metal efflux RND transporter [Gammaproteobacteria bacterium CG12_big_fil_rev_8_21_14_0_65_46_12]PIR11821.1 MAG: CusA/CzcA family heavy metal efflux RND transporter [Gammaproteobacteria bacterium CG11_big_fil_rev_8_21_14_0_20_46_22]